MKPSLSSLALYYEIGNLPQAFGSIAKHPQRCMSLQPFFFRHLTRSLQSVNCGKSDLLLRFIFAGGFAERL
jgi:hypothetical protein